VQVIVEVGMEAAVYVSEQYQSRMAAPSPCPNCGIAQTLEAQGYYRRYVTGSVRKCCKFVVEAKIWVEDRQFSSSLRTD
jgi:hypothetical protein